MENELIEKIIDNPSEREIEKFDQVIRQNIMKNVSASFTKNVMAKIQPATQKADNQIWWIVAGMVMTASIWLFGGFGNAAPIEIALPKVSLPSVEVGPLIKGFGFVNIMLILLLLDRYFQRRRKTA